MLQKMKQHGNFRSGVLLLHINLCLNKILFILVSPFQNTNDTIESLLLNDRKRILKHLEETDLLYEEKTKQLMNELVQIYKSVSDKVTKYN